MSDQRFSIWHVLGVVVIVVGLSAASLTGGVFLGYQWGRASGLATVVNTQAGARTEIKGQEAAPTLPFDGQSPFSLEPRPYLGVEFEPVTLELAQAESLSVEQGAIIRTVVAGSPADDAGIKVGDIVEQVDGQPVDMSASLRERIAGYAPGDELTLTLLHDGQTQAVKVTLGTAPANDGLGLLPNPNEQPGFHFQFRCSPEPCPFQPNIPNQNAPTN
jgi:membrane-associated protease RseP (regulator of RpoE activity)